MTRHGRLIPIGAALVVVAAFLLLRPTIAQLTPDDYLAPVLRRRVEALKSQSEREPTNSQNIANRTQVVWEWINAYSLTGGPMPVNATQTVSNIVRSVTDRKRGGPPPPRNRERQLDDIIYEFRLKDEQPGALGRLTLKPVGPFHASSWQTIELTYAVGDAPLTEGATIMIARQLHWDRGDLQNTDSSADNYISIRTSNSSARFATAGVPWVGMHGGFRSAAPRPAFRLESGTLRKGDTITLTYGDRSGGGRGWQLQTFQSEQVLLPIYLDLDGKGRFLSPAWPAFEVLGNEAVAAKGFAPSVVEPGEEFELAIRSEDFFYNRATGKIPAYGEPAVNVLDGIKIDREGIYRFGFRSPDGKVTGTSNPIWVQRNPAARIYWGETHTHTGMAEGQGSIEGSYRFGREDARLDFLGLSEHDIWLDDYEWQAMQRAVEHYTEPGKFIAFLGYEWTVRRQWGGHHNVFFPSPQRKRVGAQIAPNLSALYQGLRERYDTNDVVIIPHAHQAGDWRKNDPEMETLIEIMSMHGTFEWFGNYYLKRGHQVGFIAASDDHRSRPGYSGVRRGSLTQYGGLAAVLAQEKTNDAIFDALKQRKAYAVTSSERIIVDLQMNGQEMGTRLPFTEERRLRARVMGTAPISEVAVVKNGDVVFTKRPSQGSISRNATVLVGFESSSEPFFRDNPRPVRRWEGTLEVRGTKLKGFQTSGFLNRFHHEAAADSSIPNKVRFRTITRGRATGLLLELEGAALSTEIILDLDETVEFGKAPVMIRGYKTIPAQRVRLPFGELNAGLLVKDVPVGRDPDTISIQLVGDNRPLDYDFDFVDTGEMGRGDYYYVRVKQLNGAMAWSSPVWVGGEEPR